MIDEKKIEEAAFESLRKDEDVLRHNIGNAYIEGYHAGINWFLDNLWHDGEEVPTEKNKNVLRYFESYSVGERECDYDEYYELCNTGEDGFNENTWMIFCDIGGWCSKWLYIEDLIKGGK